MSHKKYVIAQ